MADYDPPDGARTEEVIDFEPDFLGFEGNSCRCGAARRDEFKRASDSPSRESAGTAETGKFLADHKRPLPDQGWIDVSGPACEGYEDLAGCSANRWRRGACWLGGSRFLRHPIFSRALILFSGFQHYHSRLMVSRKFSSESHVKLSQALLAWYDANARDLPWRVPPAARKPGRRPDPYRVWLSEIMLQQTTVGTVRARYEDFLTRWPNVEALAAASLEDVLAVWAGLGYYARARNLHACARVVATAHGGVFPNEEKTLRALPGVGAYTAAAIAAIAFDRKAIVVDGNIERVTARLFAVETLMPAAKRELLDRAALFWPESRSGDFAQGMMDLGATICTPRKPGCDACPIAFGCAALKMGEPGSYPKRPSKRKRPTRRGAAFVLTRPDGSVLLRRREQKGLLGGMLEVVTSPWTEEFPKEPLRFAPAKANWVLAPVRVVHTFSHFHLELDVFRAQLGVRAAGAIEGLWTKDPETAGLPTVMRKVVEAARANLA